MAIAFNKKERIAYITINRPEFKNALNVETLKQFQDVIQTFNRDDDLRVAIITGAGDTAFSVGMDINEVAPGKGQDPGEAFWRPDISNTRLLHENRVIKPVIAAVNGYCVGIALNLVLDCDIRIASEKASFLSPEVKSGLCARMLGILLSRSIPLSKVMEMVLTGDPMTAQEAYQLGLVSRLVASEELMPTAEAIARSIAANAPLAVRATKEAVMRGIEMPFEHASRLADSLAYAVQNSEDYQEGLKAFREKKKPEYKGK